MTSQFWDNVIFLLNRKEMSQKWLADVSMVGKTAINSGISRKSSPSADNAFRIAQALGTSIEYLITGKDPAGLRQDEREILNAFNNLNGEGKRAAIGAVTGLAVAFPLDQAGALSGTGA